MNFIFRSKYKNIVTNIEKISILIILGEHKEDQLFAKLKYKRKSQEL